jgi:hypothetical protein
MTNKILMPRRPVNGGKEVKPMTSTYQIESVTIYAFTGEEAIEISQADEDYRPFDDNGGATDGPSWLVDESEWPYDLPVENILSLSHPLGGYRLDGYNAAMQEAFQSAGIGRWMGHQSMEYALFIATDKQLAALEAALAELVVEK